MTPEQLREEADACEQDYAAGHPIDIGAPEFIRLARAHAAALEEIERLKGLLAAAAKELPHCSGPVHERIAVYRREHAKQIEQAERRAERLKFHAEAMAIAWEKLDFDDGESEDAMEEAVFSYRADFQKE